METFPLGRLPTPPDGARCGAGKWRPERNALRLEQRFAGQEGTLPTGCQRSVVRSGATGTSRRRGQPPLSSTLQCQWWVTAAAALPRGMRRGGRWLCSRQRSRGERGSVTPAEDQGVKRSQPRCKTDAASILPARSVFASPVTLEMF